MPSENNKRIAKNTLMLYFRMLFTMGVSLYTSRIVLNMLGITDYGIYNIIGGVVVLFSFLQTAMSIATQRFLNFEIGRKDFGQLRNIFSISVNVHIIIAIIAFLLAETIGLWFVNSKLNIHVERMVAVNWVYQFCIVTLLVGILQTPYIASIISYERMSLFAYISIIEALLKLIMVFILIHVDFDKLELYSLLIFIIALIVFMAYFIYCNNRLESCRYTFVKGQALYRQLLSFSGWSLFGSIANIGKTQVVNIMLNLFYGVSVNAAFGVANQVGNAMNGFVTNFQLAFNPQIVKFYAANEFTHLKQLVFQSSKFSYFLFLIIFIPMVINIHDILFVWLKIVPKYSSAFCTLTIIYLLIETLSGPIYMTIQATGKIRKYQIVISSLLLLNVPVSYLLLKFNFKPYSVLYGSILIGVIIFITRMLFLRQAIKFSIIEFAKHVLIRVSVVTILSILVGFALRTVIDNLIVIIVVTLLWTSLMVYSIGLNISERLQVNKSVLKIIRI